MEFTWGVYKENEQKMDDTCLLFSTSALSKNVKVKGFVLSPRLFTKDGKLDLKGFDWDCLRSLNINKIERGNEMYERAGIIIRATRKGQYQCLSPG